VSDSCSQKLSDGGKLQLLQEMYQEWPFMQVSVSLHHRML